MVQPHSRTPRTHHPFLHVVLLLSSSPLCLLRLRRLSGEKPDIGISNHVQVLFSSNAGRWPQPCPHHWPANRKPHTRQEMTDRPTDQPQAAEATSILEVLPLAYRLLKTIAVVTAVLAIAQEVFKNPLVVDFCTKIQLCMNALDFYGVLLEWTWNHVTDWNMYLIQSATTACALSWYVTTGQIGGAILTYLQAFVSSLADVMEASTRTDQYPWS